MADHSECEGLSQLERLLICNICCQEVAWPPPATQIKEKQVLDSIKTLPNLSGVVHMGKARRQRMDEEFERVVEASAGKYTSHPFTKGKDTISRTWGLLESFRGIPAE